EPELNHWLRGKNALCDYLVDHTVEAANEYAKGKVWSRPIWDVTAIGWMAGEGFMRSRLIPAPIPEYDGHYAIDASRHLICYVDYIERDKLFFDLTEKITGVAPQY
ncbi:MAG: nucleoside hydrolase, partial [Clostridia bacterium]|nr:nucleoside hydrolase [Clostridia bacterium]